MTNRPTLRAARENAGLSQLQLAIRAGISPQTVSRVERGREPTWSAGLRIAEELGVDVSALRALFGEVRS